jgi:hypothetical protein
MAGGIAKVAVRRSIAAFLSAVAGAAILSLAMIPLSGGPADAQVFYSIYGGYRKSPPAPYRDDRRSNSGSFSDFFGTIFGRHDEENPQDVLQHNCVRICDGKFFPISRGERKDIPLDRICSAMCPATPTKVYSGRGINNSFASDGQRYTASPNAFLYRTKIVENCSCNGRDPFGIVNVPLENDLTLEGGDLVVGETGFTVFRGGKNFTPIERAGWGAAYVKQLQAIKILPDNPHATFAKTMPVMETAPELQQRSPDAIAPNANAPVAAPVRLPQ